MQYEKFKNTFNRIVFGSSKRDLLKKIAEYPDRYIGIFRPTKPKAKILQNLTQSNEIRFGDAFERIIRDYFEENEYERLNKNIELADSSWVVADQLIKFGDTTIFVEQKIRDDHDSTKKRGQIDNFKKKVAALAGRYGKENLKCFFFFIDPKLQKNKNYYSEEIRKVSEQHEIEAKLVYGRELFDSVGLSDVWDEIIEHLKEWRKELPDLPEVNFDVDAEDTFEEIKELSPSIFLKLFGNEDLETILDTLFPTGETLRLLSKYFEGKGKKRSYRDARNLINARIAS